MTSGVTELLRVPITYEAADGTTAHSPLAAATVAGVETLLVLDTGSDAHLLTAETAERGGLPLEDGEEGTDHASASLPSWSTGDVGVSLAAARADAPGCRRDSCADALPEQGIGGILSPQHLHLRVPS